MTSLDLAADARSALRPATSAPMLPVPDAIKAWRDLTDTASGYLIRDERGRAISRVTPAGNRFAAWAHGDPLGEFDAPGRDENAVLAAHHARRRTRR